MKLQGQASHRKPQPSASSKARLHQNPESWLGSRASPTRPCRLQSSLGTLQESIRKVLPSVLNSICHLRGALDACKTLGAGPSLPFCMSRVYKIEQKALIKIILHSFKYPSAPVNGILLGRPDNTPHTSEEAGSSETQQSGLQLQILDSVPLCHSFLSLAPALEVAFIQASSLLPSLSDTKGSRS